MKSGVKPNKEKEKEKSKKKKEVESSDADESEEEGNGGGSGPPSGDFANTFEMSLQDVALVRRVGKGNFGEVWEGNYIGTKVAVKKLFFTQEELMQIYIRREVATLRGVCHPHIVQLMGIVKAEGNVYIVTEFVGGGTLRDKLRDRKIQLSWRRRLGFARDIALAMAYLHHKEIIHRDLKSANLLIGEGWKIKVCDFGLARKSPSSEEEAKLMSFVGTDEWMAPEVALEEKYGKPADVFSYGMVLWELITRKKPPERKPREKFAFNADEYEGEMPNDTPPKLWKLLCDCADFEPAKRPGFKQILERLAEIELDFDEDSGNEDENDLDAENHNGETSPAMERKGKMVRNARSMDKMRDLKSMMSNASSGADNENNQEDNNNNINNNNNNNITNSSNTNGTKKTQSKNSKKGESLNHNHNNSPKVSGGGGVDASGGGEGGGGDQPLRRQKKKGSKTLKSESEIEETETKSFIKAGREVTEITKTMKWPFMRPQTCNFHCSIAKQRRWFPESQIDITVKIQNHSNKLVMPVKVYLQTTRTTRGKTKVLKTNFKTYAEDYGLPLEGWKALETTIDYELPEEPEYSTSPSSGIDEVISHELVLEFPMRRGKDTPKIFSSIGLSTAQAILPIVIQPRKFVNYKDE
jgi:serine/threonine protein kinase